MDEAEMVRSRIEVFLTRLKTEAAQAVDPEDTSARYRSYAIANAARTWAKETSETNTNGAFYAQASTFVERVDWLIDCSSQKGQLAGYEWVRDQLDSL